MSIRSQNAKVNNKMRQRQHEKRRENNIAYKKQRQNKEKNVTDK